MKVSLSQQWLHTIFSELSWAHQNQQTIEALIQCRFHNANVNRWPSVTRWLYSSGSALLSNYQYYDYLSGCFGSLLLMQKETSYVAAHEHPHSQPVRCWVPKQTEHMKEWIAHSNFTNDTGKMYCIVCCDWSKLKHQIKNKTHSGSQSVTWGST